jgi:hypothetical protein
MLSFARLNAEHFAGDYEREALDLGEVPLADLGRFRSR